jgi:hypothetical protein
MALALVAGFVFVGAPNTADAACSIVGTDIQCDGANDSVTVSIFEIYDYVYGAGGNDILTNNGFINNHLEGGAGNDLITNNQTAEGLAGDGGDDTLINNGGVYHMHGDGGADWLINNGIVDGHMSGDGGADTIINNGEVWYDILGGGGADWIQNWGYVDNDIYGGNGADFIENWGTVYDDIFGGDGADTIINYASGNVGSLRGNNGNDWIENWGYVDFAITGGLGNDVIFNGGYVENIWAYDGNDTVIGIPGSVFDTANGGDNGNAGDYFLGMTENAYLNGPTTLLVSYDCSVACPTSVFYNGHLYFFENFEFIQAWK